MGRPSGVAPNISPFTDQSIALHLTIPCIRVASASISARVITLPSIARVLGACFLASSRVSLSAPPDEGSKLVTLILLEITVSP